MLTMIVFMILVMITKSIYHAFNAYNALHNDFWKEHIRMNDILKFLPIAMMSMTCSINVRNWIHYYIKIKEIAYARKR